MFSPVAAKGDFSYVLRKDFKYTDMGNKIIDGCFVALDGIQMVTK